MCRDTRLEIMCFFFLCFTRYLQRTLMGAIWMLDQVCDSARVGDSDDVTLKEEVVELALAN